MAKKNYRPTAAQRKKVADKQLAEKQAKRREIWQKYKKQIITGAAVAVAAIIVLALAIDFFYIPQGAVRTFMGSPMGLSENALVRGIGDHYYEFGTVTTPEGYAPADYGMSMTSDPHETYYYFETADEARAVNNVYISGVENKTGADMVEMLSTSGLYNTITEAKQVEIAGKQVNYVYTQSPTTEDPAEPYFASLVMYVDTVADSCVLVTCTSAQTALEELPTEEAMMAEAEGIFSAITIK